MTEANLEARIGCIFWQTDRPHGLACVTYAGGGRALANAKFAKLLPIILFLLNYVFCCIGHQV